MSGCGTPSLWATFLVRDSPCPGGDLGRKVLQVLDYVGLIGSSVSQLVQGCYPWLFCTNDGFCSENIVKLRWWYQYIQFSVYSSSLSRFVEGFEM